ncbi:MAG TPA: STAS domain-containing protein [Anaerolineae bacterium]|jgi:anti-sigma B factor antagonist|nr:STAS domain-containing protein [Anaerolineae bacterium]
MEQAFCADVRQDGKTAVIVMSGEINSQADPALDNAYSAAEELAPDNVTLDFAGVDYINSTGIALIVGVLARARAAHRPVRAAGLSDHYREIFTITRLSDFMEIQ